jgi:hypothetical protein
MNRRQFFRACMYVAPVALVAPKAVSFFLPPRQVFTWTEYNNDWSVYFDEYSRAARDLRALLLKAVGEAPREFAVTPERYAKIVRGMQLSGHLQFALEHVDVRHVMLMGIPVVPVTGLDALLAARV